MQSAQNTDKMKRAFTEYLLNEARKLNADAAFADRNGCSVLKQGSSYDHYNSYGANAQMLRKQAENLIKHGAAAAWSAKFLTEQEAAQLCADAGCPVTSILVITMTPTQLQAADRIRTGFIERYIE